MPKRLDVSLSTSSRGHRSPGAGHEIEITFPKIVVVWSTNGKTYLLNWSTYYSGIQYISGI